MAREELVDGFKYIVLDRLREICPLEKISEMDVAEAKRNTEVAFEIIGYKPKNFDEAFQNVWESSDATDLSDFIFEVWSEDK